MANTQGEKRGQRALSLLSTMNRAISTMRHREMSTFVDMTPTGNENLGILDFRVSNQWQTLSNAFFKHSLRKYFFLIFYFFAPLYLTISLRKDSYHKTMFDNS